MQEIMQLRLAGKAVEAVRIRYRNFSTSKLYSAMSISSLLQSVGLYYVQDILCGFLPIDLTASLITNSVLERRILFTSWPEITSPAFAVRCKSLK